MLTYIRSIWIKIGFLSVQGVQKAYYLYAGGSGFYQIDQKYIYINSIVRLIFKGSSIKIKWYILFKSRKNTLNNPNAYLAFHIIYTIIPIYVKKKTVFIHFSLTGIIYILNGVKW